MARLVLTVKVLELNFLPLLQLFFTNHSDGEREILLDCMHCIKCGVSPADGIREAVKKKKKGKCSDSQLCTSLLQHPRVTDSTSLSVTYSTWLLLYTAFLKRQSFRKFHVLNVTNTSQLFAKIQVVTCVYLNFSAVCYLSLKPF